MSIHTAHWFPPSLCGCELLITADWVTENDGKPKYQHPRAHTITDIKIINVCAEHKSQTLSMPDHTVFFSKQKLSGAAAFLSAKYNTPAPPEIQMRGYLTYPIANPTPAECLYTFFSMHGGQIEHLVCGCRRYAHIDHTNYEAIKKHERMDVQRVKVYKPHPNAQHYSHCHFHHNDTPDHAQAVADHEAYHAQAAEPSPAPIKAQNAAG